MIPPASKTPMLRAVAKHPLSKTFSVRDGDIEVATVSLSWFTENASARVHGRTVQLSRQRFFSGPFEIEIDGEVIAKANKASAFRSRFEVHLAGAHVVLERESWYSWSFIVLRGDEQIGRIERDSLFTRAARLDLPEEWPLEIQLFVLWLVLVIWRRMNSA